MVANFKFENKIGWAELVSLLALLVSFVSLYYTYQEGQQNLPNLRVDEYKPYAEILDENCHCNLSKFAISLPFNLINSGGRDATIVKLDYARVGLSEDSEDELFPANFLYRMHNGKIINNDTIKGKVYLLEVNDNFANKNKKVLCEAKKKSLDFPIFLNQKIPSGDSKFFELLVCLEDNSSIRIEETDIVIVFNAIFSDGKKHGFAYGIKNG